MAYTQAGPSMPTKLSFAKIAAMPAPSVTPALPNIIRDSKGRTSNAVSQHQRNDSQLLPVREPSSIVSPDLNSHVKDIRGIMSNLSVEENATTNISALAPLTICGENVADDHSQVSTSSFKQQSFDTKSLASVTTFALDEKESIRPDDSASVRAADEDDVHPGLSRNSSFQHEPEALPVLSKSNVRMISPNVTIAAQRYPYTTLANPPRFGDLPVESVTEATFPQTQTQTSARQTSSLVEENASSEPINNKTPDEKLIEALSSLKDRLPLLQLEEKLMAFTSSNRESTLELPPQNSFMRLLTHKLADYYNLAHHINDENNSVRIFKADHYYAPVSLAEIAKSIPIGLQPSHATQVKIMRRVLGPRQFSAGNSTAASSSVPSKTTSENGVETNSEEGLQSPLEGTPNKDRSRLTLQEREAQYKAARDRIFGSDFQEPLTSESGSTGEVSVSMSRSSSCSGRRKSRKQAKTPKDDTFEARSSFVPSYGPLNMQPTYQQVYNDVQYAGAYNPATFGTNSCSGGPSPNFLVHDPSSAYGNHLPVASSSGGLYNGMEMWPNQQQQTPTAYYNYSSSQNFQQQQQAHQSMAGAYMPAFPSGLPQPSNWMANQYQSMYMQQSGGPTNGTWQGNNNSTLQSPMPYQYGQLPPPSHMTGIPFANQHPVPGSSAGAKSLFNPQTRSFIPNNASARGGGRGGRKKGQGSGSTRNSGASSPAVSNLSESTHGKSKEDSLQQKYGTPPNLPKKPPPSQVSGHFGGDHGTVSNSVPLVVNGNGQGSAS